jgi:two-component system LytT family response regulator
MKSLIDCVIVEDTKENRQALKALLSKIEPQVSIAGEAETVDEAYDVICNTQPNLVFLDIQLKDRTSFDLLDRLYHEGKINFEIIFVTAYGKFEYATKAISFSALDYITKPVDPEKLEEAVQKASEVIKKESYVRQVKVLLENLAGTDPKLNRIAIHLTKGVIEFISINDIVYLEADGTITYVHLSNGEKLNAMRHLGYYSRLLTAEYQYYPISNKILVNLNFVKRYVPKELAVTLTNGNTIYASRRGGRDFKNHLNNSSEMSGKLSRGFWERLMGN